VYINIFCDFSPFENYGWIQTVDNKARTSPRSSARFVRIIVTGLNKHCKRPIKAVKDILN
jgi:hypothetical protein